MVRAAKFYRIHEPLKIVETSFPRINSHEVLLKVRAASVCHSDIHAINGIFHMPTPVVLGHEIAGDVVEIGSDVTSINVHDRAVVHFLTPCGDCQYCLRGQITICQNINSSPMYGWYNDGGYQEYIKVEANRLVKVPENVSSDFAATLGCAGITALHATSHIAKANLGDTVIVYGAGGVGMYVLQLAKLRGAHTIAVGRKDEKLKMVQKYLDVDAIINVSKEDVHKEIMAITRNKGADIVFDLVVNQASVDLNMHMLSSSGKLVMLGIGSEPVYLNPKTLTMKEISVLGSMAGTKDELQMLVELASQGKLKGIVNSKFGLEEINDALGELEQGNVLGRACIDPQA